MSTENLIALPDGVNFEEAAMLEPVAVALSTMDYVANSLLGQYATADGIKRKFREIKGSKFDETMVNSTYQELVELKLIA